MSFCLWIFSGLFIALGTLYVCNENNVIYAKRPFEIKILETGYEFFLENKGRPN